MGSRLGQNVHTVSFVAEDGATDKIVVQSGSPIYVSSTEMTVYVKVVDAAAAAGAYKVVVTGADNQQNAELTNALTVTPKDPPVISDVNPKVLPQGATDIQLSIDGENFQQGQALTLR